MIFPEEFLSELPRFTIGGAPEGVDAVVLGELARRRRDGPILHVALDEAHMARMAGGLAFFSPELQVLTFPAWDCLPYDRISPNSQVVGRRIDTLSRLAAADAQDTYVLVTTVSAFLQRVPPRNLFKSLSRRVKVGELLAHDDFTGFLDANGYLRSGTVREPGEFAVRGGIIDVYPPGTQEPVRIDLFGDVVDGIRNFDPMSQLSTGQTTLVEFKPVSEVLLDDASVARFRSRYRELFGTVGDDDPLYAAMSARRRHTGMEHWLPLFHERLESLVEYIPDCALTVDHAVADAIEARLEQIQEFYDARRTFLDIQRRSSGRRADAGAGAVYRPVPPEQLYFSQGEWREMIETRPGGAFSPFVMPEEAAVQVDAFDAGGKRRIDFAAARARTDVNLFDEVCAQIDEARSTDQSVLVAGYSAGSRDRLAVLLRDHGVTDIRSVETMSEVEPLGSSTVAVAVLDLENGFTLPGLILITEQDILGDRLTRSTRRRRQSEAFITEVSTLAQGDLVVHVEHGIGRYDGLVTLQIAGAPHDCLCVIYAGGDKLFVPVESIEVLSRYGSEQGQAQLDRLGSAAWQSRKARVKMRIRDIAQRLIKIAAERYMQPAVALRPPGGLFDEFCARFPFPETEDQLRAIDDTIDDLGTGRPMDRLICGDVGFGKTEVALRAAFVAVMSGMQAAVVVPTTLLCRQHFQTFRERFGGLPVNIEQLSRFVSAKRAGEIKEGICDGTTDIVIGTHALLAKSVRFANLGLLVIDEEQHFGVAQKERLKELRSDVHVLTLTATPIPRTLQMALSGVREMSLIATPPVDRLAVRTFVLPYDPVVVREAILREHFRGGQTFYVCPRIEDLARVRARVVELIPELKVAIAHGRMASRTLEEVMSAFYDGQIHVLLCTNIIESGLDIPTANTLIIHRADMFGLAQLYQLRGRIGRAKVRAYAYLTLPPNQALRDAAAKRLQVMQTLDSLGAGFTLASHDLDIRGAGNLLGEEQSGHIREIGIELYQSLLEETVTEIRATREAEVDGRHHHQPEWTPQITIGTSVLIPDSYVSDLGVRLGLYRRVARLGTRSEIDAFAAELIDRFGPLPVEVENLLRIVEIKQLCLAAGIEKVDVGPKGAVLSFRDNQFANPEGLIAFISAASGTAKLRPDHRLVYRQEWTRQPERIEGLHALMKQMVEIAAAAPN